MTQGEAPNEEHAKAENQLRTITNYVDAQLRGVDSSPFSVEAFLAVKRQVAIYISYLVDESVKLAKHHQSDVVSASYVEQSARYLVASTSKRPKPYLGTIGGAILGAGLSTILSMSTTGQFTQFPTLLSVGLSIVGTFMIALEITKG